MSFKKIIEDLQFELDHGGRVTVRPDEVRAAAEELAERVRAEALKIIYAQGEGGLRDAQARIEALDVAKFIDGE